MRETVYLSTAYLAPIEYYKCLVRYPEVVVESQEHYTKQSYRNRCVVLTANGLQSLSIPIEKPETPKCFTRDIRIAQHGDWRHLHWNALVSAYNSSPFFEYYEDDFRPFFTKQYDFLFDFNESLRELVCGLIDIEPSVSYSETYKINLDPDEVDLRELIHPKKERVTEDFKPYYQVFESRYGFQENLSIIDLLFNTGPESVFSLR